MLAVYTIPTISLVKSDILRRNLNHHSAVSVKVTTMTKITIQNQRAAQTIRALADEINIAKMCVVAFVQSIRKSSLIKPHHIYVIVRPLRLTPANRHVIRVLQDW